MADRTWRWHAQFLATGILPPLVYLSNHNISHDRGHGVGVTEGNEVCILQKVIDHHEDDAFAVHLGKPFNEIK